MRLPRTATRIAVAIAGFAAIAVSPLITATPAHACSTNAYRVVWDFAGVYARPSHDSYPITTKRYDNRVTGPTGWGHEPANGYSWTKVWVYSEPGWREGWMRDDAVTFTGCN